MRAEVKFQLRLGLVMKGGSSLAVYMNGMTQELLALVRASQARRLKGVDPEPAWVRKARLENPYYQILDHYNIDAVIDVIAGTSAGGLNGLMLAKALASGAPDLDQMTELWKQTAQIYKLAMYDADPKSVLSGQLLYDEMKKVMEGLTDQADPELAAMVPILDLFVTATDVRGHKWVRRDKFNQKLEGKAHRYLFHLKKRSRPEGSDRGYNHNDFVTTDPDQQSLKDALLAKIGGATSAFPAVFPPIRISRAEGEKAGMGILSDVDPVAQEGVWFSDGGILVNSPFDPVIETIFQRSAMVPVKRVLAFIEPDPEVVKVPQQTEPTMVETALSAVVLPMNQDILESLDRLKRENAKRRELLRLVSELDEAVGQTTAGGSSVLELAAEASQRVLAEVAPSLHVARAAPHSPVMSAYYRARLYRLRELLQGALDHALEGLGIAEDGPKGRRAVVKAMIEAMPHLRTENPEQTHVPEFLRTFDVEYHSRRLHFLLARLHQHFAPGVVPEHPEQVEVMLGGLWDALEDWNNAAWLMGHAGRLAPQPGRWAAPCQELNLAFQRLARDVQEDRPWPVAETVGAIRTFMSTLSEYATGAEAAALDLAPSALQLQPGSPMENQAPLTPEALTRVNQMFDSRDVILFPLQTYALGAEWDAPELIQFTPANATRWVNKQGKAKLAGDALGHFAAFLDERWRSNDIMWGRLDCAEILTRMIVSEAQEVRPDHEPEEKDYPEVVRTALSRRRRQILKAFPDLIDIDLLQARSERAPAPAVVPLPTLSWSQRIRFAFDTVARGQVALAKLPPEQAPVFTLDRVPDEVLRDYLLKDYKVGTEGIDTLPPRRVAAEILMILHNTAYALQKTAPTKAQNLINKWVLFVLKPLNVMARLVLLPRQGLLGMIQGNLISLMTLVGLALILLRLTGAISLSQAGWAVTGALLFPFGLNLFILMFRRTLMRIAAVVLVGALLVTGLASLGAYLEGLAEYRDLLEVLSFFWWVFAAAFTGYLFAVWVQESWRQRVGRSLESAERKRS